MNTNYKIISFLLSFFLFASIPFISAQTGKTNFSKIDTYARSVKGITDIGKLSHKLTQPYHTDLEKTRSIFIWVAENISYDAKEYHVAPDQSSYSKLFSKIDISAKNINELYDQEIAKYVLKNKKGICAGYAALFKALCDSSNLKTEIVNGIAKNSAKEIGTAMSENHAWNAVFLDNKWQLLDATWASGSCDDSVKKFTKKFNESYFLTPPNKLIINHFPTDPKWFLFPNPPQLAQFLSYPLAYEGYFKNNISAFSPMNAVIEGKIGNKTSFSITTPAEGSTISVSSEKGNNDVNIKKQEKIVTYEYTVSSDKEDQLSIFLNDEAVFTYRIVVVAK